MSDQLFISDLHLSPERPQIIDLFVRFSLEIAANAKTLYILGDFLEYWLGDDDKAEGLEPVFSALRRLSSNGTDIYFMHGNRDFLVGDKLAERCQFQLIDDPQPVLINQQPALLMHGDTLCTDDIEYQQFRATVRSPQWQQQILNKTLPERELLAKSLRDTSQLATADKLPDIMDVNQQAVEDIMQQHNIQLLIHGHTHRPAIHDLCINEKNAKRIVLGDWYTTGSYLTFTEENQPELNTFS